MDPQLGAAAATSPPPDEPDTIKLKDYKYEIKCAECNKTYTDTVLYQKHYVELHLRLDIVYTCPLCYENFDDHTRYFSHYRGHFARDEFESGKYAKNLSSRKKKLHKQNIYSCGQCKKSFSTRRGLKMHIAGQHSDIKYTYACKECGKVLNSQNGLTVHLESHKFGRHIMCDLCGTRFSQKVNWKIHMKRYHEEKLFACNTCDKTFSSPAALKTHSASHSDRKYMCKICDKGFKTERYMKIHFSQHNAIKSHVCEICNKGFANVSKLKQHLNTHAGERPFKCQFCPSSFTNFSNRLKHVRRMHKNETDPLKEDDYASERPFKCQFCPSRFTKFSNRLKHLRRMHKNETDPLKEDDYAGKRPFKCQFCPSRFSKFSNRLKHLRRMHKNETDPSKEDDYAGERPFKCQFCPSRFTNFSNRLKHVRRMHKNETDPLKEDDSELVRASDVRNQETSNKLTDLPTDKNDAGNFPQVALTPDELLEELELSISYIREQMNGCDAISIREENHTSIGAVVPTDICDTGDYNSESNNCNKAYNTTSEETDHPLHPIDPTMNNNNVNCYNRGEITTMTNAVLPNTQPSFDTVDDILTDVNNLTTSYASTSPLLYINNNYASSNLATNDIGIHHFNAANVIDYPVQMSSNSYIILMDSSAEIDSASNYANIGSTVEHDDDMFVMIPNGVRLQQSSLLSVNKM